MSSFNDGLFLEKIGRRKWRTTREVTYHVGHRGSQWAITIPAGNETDGGSQPRLLWIFWPPFGAVRDHAFVLHDHLYRSWFLCLARVVADAIMIEAMLVLGALEFVDAPGAGRCRRTLTRAQHALYRLNCWIIFYGVRLGGWVTYRKYRRQAAQGRQIV